MTRNNSKSKIIQNKVNPINPKISQSQHFPQSSQPSQPSQPSQSPSIMSNIKEGMAVGFGAGLGRSVFDKIDNFFTGKDKNKQYIQPNCLDEQRDFLTCLKNEDCKNKLEKEETLKKCLNK